MSKLSLYTVFHLNLAYSSIAEETRPEVVKQCYWPLLDLAEAFPGTIALVVTGYTLEQMARLDPVWVAKLRALLAAQTCELVGSGYCQIIGPLVPAAVNAVNLRLGMAVYDQYLGYQPTLAFVNELSYSAGLPALYRAAGYRGLLMEWNNAASNPPDWSPELEYTPQLLRGAGATLPVIWINSKAFQYFQRFAHGDETITDYLAYLGRQVTKNPRSFSLYGSDTEVFDFRPRRYESEAALAVESEWARIRSLLTTLQSDGRFIFTTPGRLLAEDSPQSRAPITLETPAQPIVVKKQVEYNVVRWGLTGRDDLGLNTACYRLARAFNEQGASDEDWRRLCYFWSSDFRTHIGSDRFNQVKTEIEQTLARLVSSVVTSQNIHERQTTTLEIKQHDDLLTVIGPAVTAIFNRRRGLAIESLIFPAISTKPILGRLPLGFFGDALLDSDFNSGHTVIELPGRTRLKDLKPVEPVIEPFDAGIKLQATITFPLGQVSKEIIVWATGELSLQYDFAFSDVLPASIRTGIMSFNPEVLALESLGYEVANGGVRERFFLAQAGPISSEPLSLLVSARSALGNTDGRLSFFDRRAGLEFEVDQTVGAALPMLHFQVLPRTATYLLRVFFSLAEIDDTNRHLPTGQPFHARFFVRLRPIIFHS